MSKLSELDMEMAFVKEGLRRLEHDYKEQKKGKVYQQRKILLENKLKWVRQQVSNLGCNSQVVGVIFAIKQMVPNTPNHLMIRHKIYFSGVSPQDAESLIKLRYPDCHIQNVNVIKCGIPSKL